MSMHTCLYSEQNEEVLDLIRRLMRTNQPPLTQRLIYALKGLYPLIYEGGAWYDEICVFAVSPRAQAAVQAG